MYFFHLFPGTNFCGKNNVRISQNELGWDAALDSCCRTHDSCPRSVPPRTQLVQNHGSYLSILTNDSDFTQSDCLCDAILGECLVKVGTRGAIIWAIYVRSVQQCIVYNGISTMGQNLLRYNFNRWLNWV